jgi:hypothetical protein
MAKMAKRYPLQLRSSFYGRTSSLESGLERPVLPALECLVPPHQNVAHSAVLSKAHAVASEETGVSVT